MNTFENIKAAVASDPTVLSDKRFIPKLTTKEEVKARINIQQQANYSEEEQEKYGRYDDKINMHTKYVDEDSPGMSIEMSEEEVQEDMKFNLDQDGSCLNNPLFYEEGIDIDALLFVLNSKTKESEKLIEEGIKYRDKLADTKVERNHFEIMETYIDEKNGYSVERYNNGKETFDKLINHDSTLSKSDENRINSGIKFSRERKALAILRTNLSNTKKNYKLRYRLADETADITKKNYYQGLAKKEYALFKKLSKTLDDLKNLDKKIISERNYKYKSELLSKYVKYQQDCLRNGEEIKYTREDVKRIKKV